MPQPDIDLVRAHALLNRILELELAGVVRYTHYSFMVFGPARIPITKWMNEQAAESLGHAQAAGELITQLGGHPSLEIGPLLESHQHDTEAMLRESLEHERQSLVLYYELLALAKDRHVTLEEYSRQMIRAEEQHAGDVEKMLRRPGSLGARPRVSAAGRGPSPGPKGGGPGRARRARG
jgi:bacterioferritin